MRGDIYIISAPSGTGKSTIIRRLLKIIPGLFFSVSYTTRSPREKEINGKDYFFVSINEFENLINDNQFLEYCNVFNNYYGTHRNQVIPLIEKGLDVILDIDVKGAMKIKQNFPEAILIFMLPPSIEELVSRLSKRHSNTEKDLQTRLNTLKDEVQYYTYYDYLIINEHINKTIDEVKAIIIANRLRKDKISEIIREFINRNLFKNI